MQLSILHLKGSPKPKSNLPNDSELLEIIQKMGCAIKIEDTDQNDFIFIILEKTHDHESHSTSSCEDSNPPKIQSIQKNNILVLIVINALKEEIVRLMEQEIDKGYPNEELIEQREFLLRILKRLEMQYKKTNWKHFLKSESFFGNSKKLADIVAAIFCRLLIDKSCFININTLLASHPSGCENTGIPHTQTGGSMLFHSISTSHRTIFDAENLKELGGNASSMFDREMRHYVDELSDYHSDVSFVRDPIGSLALIITGRGMVKTDREGKLIIVFHAEPSEGEWDALEVYKAMQDLFPPVLGIIALLESKVSSDTPQDDYLREMVVLLKQNYHEKYLMETRNHSYWCKILAHPNKEPLC